MQYSVHFSMISPLDFCFFLSYPILINMQTFAAERSASAWSAFFVYANGQDALLAQRAERPLGG
jgi:hypothetical protein